ncbi:MAG: TCR/Tet family MFS transporter [Deltaproteobacteria bacterium]|nr:TCR/Tet family MFS transporter [Deltaproteobacteria bacterium]
MTGRIIILFLLFLDALGYGLLMPVLPGVVRRFNADPSFVSHFFGYFIASYAVVQFIAAPVLGNLSDRYGRRPILLTSLLGAAVDYLLMAFAPNLYLLFIGRVVSGLTGASIAVANAYMADISDDKNRTGNFGLVSAALGLGFVIGPGVGGTLGLLNPKLPFIAAAGMNLINFASALLFLPESLPNTSRRRLSAAQWNPLASLRQMFQISSLAILYWAYLLVYMAARATSTMWTLFTENRFGWSVAEIGVSLTFLGLIVALAHGILPRVAVAQLGEMRALRLGLMLSTATYVAIGLATKGWMLYVIIIVSAFSAVAGPVLQSRMSSAVQPDAQGRLQGSLASIASITGIVAPLIYTAVFAEGVRHAQNILLTGMPFFVAAVFSVIAWLLVVAGAKGI